MAKSLPIFGIVAPLLLFALSLLFSASHQFNLQGNKAHFESQHEEAKNDLCPM